MTARAIMVGTVWPNKGATFWQPGGQWHYLVKQAGLQPDEVNRNSASLMEEDCGEGEMENGHNGKWA